MAEKSSIEAEVCIVNIRMETPAGWVVWNESYRILGTVPREKRGRVAKRLCRERMKSIVAYKKKMTKLATCCYRITIWRQPHRPNRAMSK